ncbi:hypothetical protein SFC88_05990 [Nocardioides sp. HM23]|uniref:LVIVD repeat-containing protein n=1 Tax=Nocardioides bizhenqiangii TaxID=3095076 RepID=UPI002ACAF1EA|nr:hypothetical protein [Nocardioides sp. HM23]MDZ5620362.1 hypothetical protein [Nocardioides sp. HM23]
MVRSLSARRGGWRQVAVAAVAAATVVGGGVVAAVGGEEELAPAVPVAGCAEGSLPETSIQGRVPAADHESGRAAQGYTCNTEQVGHHGRTGGFKVQRYTDAQGHTCAYYDSTRMFPFDVVTNLLNGTGLGVVVLDMTDPAHPRKTANLITPAMLSPHESLVVNPERGLLAAVMGNLATAPGILDVYDIRTDCRRPKLLSSTPSGLLGHESGFSPDGRTFWSAGAAGFTLTAVDLTNPRRPRVVFTKAGVIYHGLRFSDDGDTMYVANMGTFNQDSVLDEPGLRIYDVSEVHAREPNPEIHLLSELLWPEASIPQVAEPFVRDGRRYVLEVDEFSDLFGDGFVNFRTDGPVGAARIVNVDDPHHPYAVSGLRLEVHQPEHRTDELFDDPGASSPVGGYSAHYCSVPTRDNPRIVACSMIGSGLRLFDISDLEHPREVGYFNKPGPSGSNALSQPAWDLGNGAVWYSDASSGLYVVRLRGDARALLAR